jgi:hypothetical protein
MRYVNRARHRVILCLNSGQTLHLSPQEISDSLDPSETDHNKQIEKLVKLREIEPLPEPATKNDAHK